MKDGRPQAPSSNYPCTYFLYLKDAGRGTVKDVGCLTRVREKGGREDGDVPRPLRPFTAPQRRRSADRWAGNSVNLHCDGLTAFAASLIEGWHFPFQAPAQKKGKTAVHLVFSARVSVPPAAAATTAQNRRLETTAAASVTALMVGTQVEVLAGWLGVCVCKARKGGQPSN